MSCHIIIDLTACKLEDPNTMETELCEATNAVYVNITTVKKEYGDPLIIPTIRVAVHNFKAHVAECHLHCNQSFLAQYKVNGQLANG